MKKCDTYRASRISIVGVSRPNLPARQQFPSPVSLSPTTIPCKQYYRDNAHANYTHALRQAGSSRRCRQHMRIGRRGSESGKNATAATPLEIKPLRSLINDNWTWPAIDYAANSFAPYSSLNRLRVSKTEDKPAFPSWSFCYYYSRAFALGKTHYGRRLEIHQLGN